MPAPARTPTCAKVSRSVAASRKRPAASTLSAIGWLRAPGMWPATGSTGSCSPRKRSGASVEQDTAPAELGGAVGSEHRHRARPRREVSRRRCGRMASGWAEWAPMRVPVFPGGLSPLLAGGVGVRLRTLRLALVAETANLTRLPAWRNARRLTSHSAETGVWHRVDLAARASAPALGGYRDARFPPGTAARRTPALRSQLRPARRAPRLRCRPDASVMHASNGVRAGSALSPQQPRIRRFCLCR